MLMHVNDTSDFCREPNKGLLIPIPPNSIVVSFTSLIPQRPHGFYMPIVSVESIWILATVFRRKYFESVLFSMSLEVTTKDATRRVLVTVPTNELHRQEKKIYLLLSHP